MQIECGAVTDQGTRRSRNDDDYLIGTITKTAMDGLEQISLKIVLPCIVAVCDGLGGSSYGQEASRKAVLSLCKYGEELKGCEPSKLIDAINDVIQKVNLDVTKLLKYDHRAGTTLAMVYIAEPDIVIANVGDSRIYTYMNGKLTRVSLDHNRFQELIKLSNGKTDMVNQGKNELTQYLGIDPEEFLIEPHFYKMRCEESIMLLCSDGLTTGVGEEEIKHILTKYSEHSPIGIASILVERAKENGSKDNITAIVIKISNQDAL